jgi:soluble lytic murein transglycosylase-like protein
MINIDKIIKIESSGRHDAISKKGAVGLMQITQICLKDYNNNHKEGFLFEDMLIPENNIKVGTWYFNERIPELLKAFSIPDCDLTRLICYNAGVLKAQAMIETLPFETENYLKKYFEVEVL